MLKRNIGIILIFSLLLSAIFAEAYTITVIVSDKIWVDRATDNTIVLDNTSRGVRIGNNASSFPYRLYIDGGTFLNGTLETNTYNYLGGYTNIDGFLYVSDNSTFDNTYTNFEGKLYSRNSLEVNDSPYPTTVYLSSETKIYYNNKEVGLNPIGTIILWTGYGGAIPLGYALCDGKSHNHITTANLTGRFIVGNSSYFIRNSTGGRNTTVLTISNLPKHAHYINYNGGLLPGVLTKVSYSTLAETSTGLNTVIKSPLTTSSVSATENNGINSMNSDSFDNKPPYYVLTYLEFVGY